MQLLTAIVIAALGATTRAAAPEAKTAQAAVALAQEAMEAKRFGDAAELMLRAYELDKDPLWLANSGYARMLAGDPTQAVEALKASLANTKLTAGARDRALDRMLAAQSASTALDDARAAEAAGELERAAGKYDDAFAAAPVGAWVLKAGLLWERAGAIDSAQARYAEAAARSDLSDEDRRAGADALRRLAELRASKPGGGTADPAKDPVKDPAKDPVKDPAKDPDIAHIALPKTPVEADGPDHTASWVLVGTGGALLAGGLVCWFVGQGDYDAVRSAQDGAGEGGISDLTRAAAADKLASGDTMTTLGVVMGSVGAAALVTGTILLFVGDSGPSTDGHTSVTLGASPDGATLGWRTSF